MTVNETNIATTNLGSFQIRHLGQKSYEKILNFLNKVLFGLFNEV